MPQWTVIGAARDTGRDVSILVEAPDAEKAGHVASALGVLVAAVTASDQSTHGSVRLAYQSQVPPARRFRKLHFAVLAFHYLGLLLLALTAVDLLLALVKGPGPSSLLDLIAKLSSLIGSAACSAFYAFACLALAALLDVAHAWAVRRFGSTAP